MKNHRIDEHQNTAHPSAVPTPAGSAAELSSWKAIAEYFHVNVRTAQKWERERRLPVHRVRGEKGRVFAFVAELEKWKESAAAKLDWWSNPRFLRVYASVATLVAVAALSALLVGYCGRAERSRPALFRTDYRTLFVMDVRGNELWHHTFDAATASTVYAGDEGQRHTWIGDIDGDSEIETIFVWFRSDFVLKGTPMFCFSEKGQLKWTYEVTRTVSDDEQSYSPGYVVGSFQVLDRMAGGKRIAVTSRHGVHHPNCFAMLDGHGAVLGEYWHSGHLDYMNFVDMDMDGSLEILLAGVNNGYEAATLVVLDILDFDGASDQQEGKRYQIHGFPLHKEKAVVFFPRSCMNRRFERYNMARNITAENGAIRVWVWERNRVEDDQYLIYTLDPMLRCTRIVPSDTFVAVHRRLRGEAVLDHDISDEELDRLRQSCRVTTPR